MMHKAIESFHSRIAKLRVFEGSGLGTGEEIQCERIIVPKA